MYRIYVNIMTKEKLSLIQGAYWSVCSFSRRGRDGVKKGDGVNTFEASYKFHFIKEHGNLVYPPINFILNTTALGKCRPLSRGVFQKVYPTTLILTEVVDTPLFVPIFLSYCKAKTYAQILYSILRLMTAFLCKNLAKRKEITLFGA